MLENNLSSDEEDLNTPDINEHTNSQQNTPYPSQQYHPYPFYAFSPYAIPHHSATGTPTPAYRPQQYAVNTPHPPFVPPTPTPQSATPSQSQKSKRQYRTARDKLDAAYKFLQSIDWTIADLNYYSFRVRDEQGRMIKRSELHAKAASKFLGGYCKHKPAEIAELWVKSPWGIPKKGRWERDAMFSMEHDFRDISPARPGLTSFAAQLVGQKLEQDIRIGSDKNGGLHTFTTGARDITDDNFGAQTFVETISALKENQKLAWDLTVRLATPRARKKEQGALERQNRPPELVAAQALSAISYSRNMYAKLLPSDKALLYFACSANRYLYAYDSRVGTGTSYHAVYAALKKLADHDLARVKKLATSSTTALMIRFDNVQSYVRPREFRIGLPNP